MCNIGRLDGDVILADPSVSSRHARIEKRGGGFFIRDLQSRNGTFVNGARITESTLTLGDKLKIGELETRPHSAAHQTVLTETAGGLPDAG